MKFINFLSFFLEKESSGVGHLKNTEECKKEYAAKSIEYNKNKFISMDDTLGYDKFFIIVRIIHRLSIDLKWHSYKCS